jgi:hypothetical protein
MTAGALRLMNDMDAKIKRSFFTDKNILALTPGEKLAFLWLAITCDNAGFREVVGPVYSLETSLPIEDLWSAVAKVPTAFVRDGDHVFVRKFLHHQLAGRDGDRGKISSNNCFSGVRNAYKSQPSDELRAALIEEYPELEGALEGGQTKVVGNPHAEEIYAAYPRKVGKPKAIQAILRALQSCKDPGWLLDRTKAYAKSREGQDPQYTPHPATWFNQSRYNDELETPKTPRITPAQADYAKEQIRKLRDDLGYECNLDNRESILLKIEQHQDLLNRYGQQT